MANNNVFLGRLTNVALKAEEKALPQEISQDASSRRSFEYIESPKQTCLEKRGFKERKRLLAINFDKNGYKKGNKYEYSARHKNAISEQNKIKGKGIGSGGHTYFNANYGAPKENPNAINYQNFLTISDNSRTIGGKIDIDTRNDLYLTRRYNQGVNEYSSLNEDALSDGNVLGKGTGLYLDTTSGGGGYDVLERLDNISRNGWREDLQYTKMLVNSEYDIQTEFEISSYGEELEQEEWETAYNDYKKQYDKTEKAKKRYKEKYLDTEVNKDNQQTKPSQIIINGLDNPKDVEKPYNNILDGNENLFG